MYNEYLSYQNKEENNFNSKSKLMTYQHNADLAYQKTFDYQGKKLFLFDDGIDLNEQFVNSPEKTFLIRVKGDSMIGAGIDDGNIILVDSSIKPKHGNIVVASINNRLVVKRLNYSYKEVMLLPENDNYLPIRPKATDKFKFLGVALMVIKDMEN